MKRNRLPALLALTLLLPLLAARAEEYEPPALYRSLIAAAPGGRAAAEMPAESEENDFEAVKKNLAALRAGYEKATRTPLPGESFFVPDENFSTASAESAALALAAPFRPDNAASLALGRSPAVGSAAENLSAVLFGYDQAVALDELLRRYGWLLDTNTMTGVGPMSGTNDAALRFPFPGVLSLKGKIATLEAREALETLEAARRDAVTRARALTWELLYLHRAKAATERTAELLEAVGKSATARYESGQGSFADVVRAESEAQKARETAVTLSRRIRATESELLALLDLPAETGIAAPASVEPPASIPDAEILRPRALERRQELRRLRATIERMERMTEMAEIMVFPRFDLGFSAYTREEPKRVGSAMDGPNFPETIGAGRGLGLPKKPLTAEEAAYVTELRHRTEAKRRELTERERAVEAEVEKLWTEADRARRESALYGVRVKELARAGRDAALRGYETGRGGLTETLEAERAWLAAEIAEARARSDQGAGVARLAAAVGADIDDAGVPAKMEE